MTNDVWLKLAKRINVLLAQPDVDGVVITHGTDTLEETAYFLDLVVKSAKPVVIVGAMRPSTAMSADGPFNIYNGVALAASKEAVRQGRPRGLNDQISGARDVTKTNTMTMDTFRSPELGFLGYMVGAQRVLLSGFHAQAHPRQRVRHHQPRDAPAGRYRVRVRQHESHCARRLRRRGGQGRHSRGRRRWQPCRPGRSPR